MLVQYLKYIIVGLTILTGLVSLFWPMRVLGFTGLEVSGGRGVTEIRSVLGALFIGLGAAVLYFNSGEAFNILGIVYLSIGLVRLVTMFIDRSVVSSNIISLIFEFVAGVILFL